MSEENIELVRRAWSGPVFDLEETAQAYWHPEIVYVEDPRWPGASRYEGREAVVGAFRAYTDALGDAEDMEFTLEEIHDAEERLVIVVQYRGRSASGIPHEHRWAYVVQVRDQRIAYFQAYYEPAEALREAGLSE